MKRILILLIILASSLFAAGETSLVALHIAAGARASAMGEAFTAVSDDASAVFWNPAGLAGIEQRQAHLTHNQWIQDIRNEVASIVFPMQNGVLGIGIMLNAVDGFEQRETATAEPLGSFSDQSFALTLSYGHNIADLFDIGVNLKYANERIYVDDASAYLMDVGASYHTPLPGLVAAAVVQNLGYSTEFDKEKLSLPTTVRAGFSYVLPFAALSENVLVAAEYCSILDADSHINMGVEGRIIDLLLLRFGYQTGYEEIGTSAGFGLDFGGFKIDYAYMPFGRDLGNSHRFSLNLQF